MASVIAQWIMIHKIGKHNIAIWVRGDDFLYKKQFTLVQLKCVDYIEVLITYD